MSKILIALFLVICSLALTYDQVGECLSECADRLQESQCFADPQVQAWVPKDPSCITSLLQSELCIGFYGCAVPEQTDKPIDEIEFPIVCFECFTNLKTDNSNYTLFQQCMKDTCNNP